jgi:hypothetical protein
MQARNDGKTNEQQRGNSTQTKMRAFSNIIGLVGLLRNYLIPFYCVFWLARPVT